MTRFIAPLTAAMLLVGVGSAVAQTTTTTSTTTFSQDQGTVLREYSTTQNYTGVRDPSVQVRIGTVLPGTVELRPLPEVIKVPSAERYSYSIVNDRPVVVERTTRKVIHTWE